VFRVDLKTPPAAALGAITVYSTGEGGSTGTLNDALEATGFISSMQGSFQDLADSFVTVTGFVFRGSCITDAQRHGIADIVEYYNAYRNSNDKDGNYTQVEVGDICMRGRIRSLAFGPFEENRFLWTWSLTIEISSLNHEDIQPKKE